jgi:hypothetical protein
VNEYLDEHGDVSSQQCATVTRLRNRLLAEMRSPSAAPFVGRSDCIAFLTQAWDAAAGGVSKSVMVTGAAGMGKTRIMSVLYDYAVLRGARCVTHICGSNDRHRPLALFAHIAERLLGLRGGLGISPLARSYIARLCNAGAPAAPTSTDAIASEEVRGELLAALVDLIDAVSSEGPLLLAIDDAHLLDAASWTVLREISRKVTDRSLLVLLCTRSAQHPTRARLPLRLRTFPLGPLSVDDSRTLLLALAPDRAKDRSRLDRDLHTSAGNPFLIHALARYSPANSQPGNLPVDVSVLAASCYYSLDEDSRTLLESVLHLRELATLTRLRTVAQLDDTSFLRRLRLLEEEGLVRLADGCVECSHDLIADALRAITPQTVAAVLNARIAAHLEAECVDNRLDPTLAWAAAQAWLTAGEPVAAARLLRRCAAHAAALGEPTEAAKMLGRLLDVPLPRDEALALTADMIAHADAGGGRHLRAQSMDARIRLLQEEPLHLLPEAQKELSELSVARLECQLPESKDIAFLLEGLQGVLVDGTYDLEPRLRAAVTLLISADLLYDRGLANAVWTEVTPLFGLPLLPTLHALRVQLIYHAVFGDADKAIAIAKQILGSPLPPTLGITAARGHRNAMFALHTLGCSQELHTWAIRIYEYMRTRKVYSECVYVANTIAERHLKDGDFEAAADWVSRVAEDLSNIHSIAGGVTAGFYSTLASLASICGRADSAAAVLNVVRDRLPLLHTPRMKSTDDALWMRLNLLSNVQPSDSSLTALERAYELGSMLGRQDTVVEALWLAYRADGQNARCSELLRDYLSLRRRELSKPDWSLRYSTRDDLLWSELGYSSVSAPTIGGNTNAKLDMALSVVLHGH